MSYHDAGQDDVQILITDTYNIVPPEDTLYDVIKPGDGTACYKFANINGKTNVLIKYDSAEF